MLKQRTLKKAIDDHGRGLHTGARVELALRPAPVDTGIVFRRTDLPGARSSPGAGAHNVGDTRLSSTLKIDGGQRLDGRAPDVGAGGPRHRQPHVDIAGPEMPIMDGSAGPFVFLLQSAGIDEQTAPKRYLRITDAGRGRATATSGRASSRFNGFKLDFTIDFPHPVFGSREPPRRRSTSPSTRT